MEEEQTVTEEVEENEETEQTLEFEEIEESTIAETVLSTPSGDIHVIHQITLGDVIVIMLLSCILIFLFLSRIVRR